MIWTQPLTQATKLLRSWLYENNAKTSAPHAYRPDVDGLRAIAVAAVVVFHAFPAKLSGGFVGVDVFFVISGFLITGIIYKGLKKNDFHFSDFWARRIRRIFPALLTVITATFIAGWWYLLPAEFEALTSHIKWGLAFAANFKLNNEVGYFDTAAELKPLLHLWSLAIEEQFYLVWPGLLWILFRKRLNLFTMTLVLAILGYHSRKFFGVTKSAAFYFPWTRFWELQVGALLAIWNTDYAHRFGEFWERTEKYIYPFIFQADSTRSGTSLNLLFRSSISMVGVWLIAHGCWNFGRHTLFPSGNTLYPVLGTALIILAGKDAWTNKWLLALRPMRFLGNISFPLYLWHWPILAYTRIILTKPDERTLNQAIGLSILLSIITYYTIEKYLRFETHRVSWRAPALATSLCTLLLFVTLQQIQPRSVSFDMVATVNNASRSISTAETADVIPCNFLVPEGVACGRYSKNTENVLVFGDSHSGQYVAAYKHLLSRPEGQSILGSFWLYAGMCLPIEGFDQKLENPGHCKKFYSAVQFFIKNREKLGIKRALWAQHWPAYLDHNRFAQVENGKELAEEKKLAARKQAITALARQFQSAGIPLTIIQDNPFGKEFTPAGLFKRTLSGFIIRRESVPYVDVISRQDVARTLISKIENEKIAKTIDPLDALCTRDRCAILDKDRRPILGDDNHVTTYTAANLAHLFRPVFALQ